MVNFLKPFVSVKAITHYTAIAYQFFLLNPKKDTQKCQ